MAEPSVDLKLEIDESDIFELEIVKPSQQWLLTSSITFLHLKSIRFTMSWSIGVTLRL
jgi:hypothetical protein